MRAWVIALLLLPLLTSMGKDAAKEDDSDVRGSLAGTWDGSWGNFSQKGRILLEISPKGELKGQLTNETYELDGTLSGKIENVGETPASLKFVYRYPEGTFSGRGTALLDGEGRFVAIVELREKNGSQLGSIAMIMTRRPLP